MDRSKERGNFWLGKRYKWGTNAGTDSISLGREDDLGGLINRAEVKYFIVSLREGRGNGTWDVPSVLCC